MFTDIMIDIETLGSNPRAPIIQIGACAFSLRGGTVGRPWSILVRPDFAHTKPDALTIAWWMQQDEAARLHCATCVEHGFSELQALAALDDYITANVGADVSVWAMPPEFDLVILRNVADAHGVTLPWKYNKTRDLRTLEYLAGCSSKDRMQAAVAHDAGSDASAQSSTAIKYFRMLSLGEATASQAAT